LFFTVFVGMMPEYELWYAAWVIYALWAAARRGNWTLFAAGWLHSAFGYAYKMVYACDSRTFHKGIASPLQAWFDRHAGFDLRPFLILTACATIAAGLVFAWQLYRHDPTREQHATV